MVVQQGDMEDFGLSFWEGFWFDEVACSEGMWCKEVRVRGGGGAAWWRMVAVLEMVRDGGAELMR